MPFCNRSAADCALPGDINSRAAIAAAAIYLVVMTSTYRFDITGLLPRCPLFARATIGFMDIITGNVGWIEVICGPMFSGKSEELIRRLRRAMIARKRVEVFKPVIDTRYGLEEIVSHGDLRMRSQVV